MLFANIGPKRAFQINNRANMRPTSTKNGTNLAQGDGKGYQTINNNMKTQKDANAKHQNEKRCASFKVRRFPQKSEGSTAGRLLIAYEIKG